MVRLPYDTEYLYTLSGILCKEQQLVNDILLKGLRCREIALRRDCVVEGLRCGGIVLRYGGIALWRDCVTDIIKYLESEYNRTGGLTTVT